MIYYAHVSGMMGHLFWHVLFWGTGSTGFRITCVALMLPEVGHQYHASKRMWMNQCRVILLVENMSFPRDRRVLQEASALAGAGYRVSVICPKGTSQDRVSFEVVDGIRVWRYWQPWQGKGMVGYLLEYGWAMLCTFWLIIWIWARYGFDVLHAANPPDLFFLVAAPFQLLGKKFVYDQHDLCPELFEAKFGAGGLVERTLLLLERYSNKLASLVIVTNQSAYEIAAKRAAVRPDKLRIVRNGPDLDHFQRCAPRPELKAGATYLVLYAGTMAKQDGVDRVVRAAHHIVHERGRKDVGFVLLGDGDCLEEMQQLTRSLKVEPYVSFPGWVGDAELLPYLSTSDVCLAPDPPEKANNLSTLIKIMEYMSCGKVTVSFDLLESRRTAGPAAIYVEKDDPALFGDAILGILDDPTRREAMARAGLERVRTSLHWGLSRELLLEAYGQMIGADGPPSQTRHSPMNGA